MDCYSFEENISAFIEGELPHTLRSDFLTHKETCRNCQGRLEGMISLLDSLKDLEPISTSTEFFSKLQEKIENNSASNESIVKRILNSKPLGMQFGTAMGFAATFVILIVSSYLLFQDESVPQINIREYSAQNNILAPGNTPSTFAQNSFAAAGNDSVKSDKDSLSTIRNRFDDQILMVNRK